MFSTVRYFIKTSLAFLILGLLTGVYMSLARNVFDWGFGDELISAHTHVVLVGSVMMMIMGVALWFFPRPPQDDTRYNPDLIRAAYWIITIATATRFIFQFITAYVEIWEVRWGIAATSALQVLALTLFFYSMWGRIRAMGSAEREAKGEKF
jgi:heme/copper-type cytochrome/quinol oxidase subunit 1